MLTRVTLIGLGWTKTDPFVQWPWTYIKWKTRNW